MRPTLIRAFTGAVTVVAALTVVAPVHAGKQDLTLAKFANCSVSGHCSPNRADYETFLAEYAFGLVPKNLAPAETLGYSGFYIGLESSLTVRPVGSAANERWLTGTASNETQNVMFNPGVHIRKGLPFSFELGSTVNYLALSEIVSLGGEIKWAPFEGYRSGWRAALPDIAIRGSVVRIIGEADVDMSIVGLDGSIAYAFGIGGMITLTPYAGYQFYWTIVNQEPVLYREGNTYHTETEINGDTLWETSNLGNPLLKRHSAFFGLRFGYEVLAVTLELDWAMPNKWDLDAGDGKAKVGNQIQIGMGIGADF
jgi:hypothetical protein